MNQAPTTTSASYAASGARWLRALRVGAAAGLLALLACGPAMAQRQGDHYNDNRGPDQRIQQDPRIVPQRSPEQPPREQRFDPRSFDSREFDDRRQQDRAARAQQESRRSGRLTPDERRDLRRQINEAGMDLYSRPPQH